MTEPLAIGFDLGDTLCEYAGVPLNWEREYPAALSAVAERCGHELTSERQHVGTQVLLRYNTRRTPRQDEREYHADHVFRELLAAWGASVERVEASVAAGVAAFFGHFRQTVRAFPEAAHVLAKLHQRGLPTGVLTDVPYGMPRSFVLADLAETGLSLPDERILTSTAVGHRKPHPAGFKALARELGVPCDRVLYVGNERKDVDGGNAADCRTVLLWRSSSEAPAWGQAATIRSLEELFDLPWLADRLEAGASARMSPIRAARPDEAQAISDLAIRAKAHWPYSAEQMLIFRRELTLSPAQITAGRAHVLEEDGRLLGFYTLAGSSNDRAELEHIFVDPGRLGRGVGTALFRHACRAAAASGATSLTVQSDPHAAGFYRALGGDLTAEIDSSIPGRRIPVFTFPLPALDVD